MTLRELFLFFCQVVAVILFGCCTSFGEFLYPVTRTSDLSIGLDQYALFQQVHMMILVGFGFLMVFLKTHSWSAVGFNFVLAAWTIQITILLHGFWHLVLKKTVGLIGFILYLFPEIRISSLINADFCAGSVLITFGALLGKVSLGQMVIIATFESFFWSLNEALVTLKIEASDIEGTLIIQLFGAYFCVACNYFFQPHTAISSKKTHLHISATFWPSYGQFSYSPTGRVSRGSFRDYTARKERCSTRI